jgi:hypothetical protein
MSVIITANGSQLYAGRDFTTKLSYEELNFKYSNFLPYEAQNPCLLIGDVVSWPFLHRHCQVTESLLLFFHLFFCFCQAGLCFGCFKNFRGTEF